MTQFIDAGVDDRNPGEERVIAVVKSLPAGWLVVANKNLPLHHGKSCEIDLIIVAPHRVILLDEKSWYGKITETDEFWTLSDGAARPSPLNKMTSSPNRSAPGFAIKLLAFLTLSVASCR